MNYPDLILWSAFIGAVSGAVGGLLGLGFARSRPRPPSEPPVREFRCRLCNRVYATVSGLNHSGEAFLGGGGMAMTVGLEQHMEDFHPPIEDGKP